MKMRGFAIAGFVVLSCVVAGACSSSSNEAPKDAGVVDVLFPQACATPIEIGAGDPSANTYSGGSCNASLANVTCTYQAPCTFGDVTIYTCTCDGSSWSCAITGDGNGNAEGGSCDAGFDDAEQPAREDASKDAADDTSDASDD